MMDASTDERKKQMPKLKRPSMKYTVSFNGAYDWEYGNTDMYTADYEGDNIDDLAVEVVADDPNFPMTFCKNESTDGSIIGWFLSVESDPEDVYKVAVMVDTAAWF
jgi:hypothetical protein